MDFYNNLDVNYVKELRFVYMVTGDVNVVIVKLMALEETGYAMNIFVKKVIVLIVEGLAFVSTKELEIRV